MLLLLEAEPPRSDRCLKVILLSNARADGNVNNAARGVGGPRAQSQGGGLTPDEGAATSNRKWRTGKPLLVVGIFNIIFSCWCPKVNKEHPRLTPPTPNPPTPPSSSEEKEGPVTAATASAVSGEGELIRA